MRAYASRLRCCCGVSVGLVLSGHTYQHFIHISILYRGYVYYELVQRHEVQTFRKFVDISGGVRKFHSIYVHVRTADLGANQQAHDEADVATNNITEADWLVPFQRFQNLSWCIDIVVVNW
jgi:hypothetical protein